MIGFFIQGKSWPRKGQKLPILEFLEKEINAGVVFEYSYIFGVVIPMPIPMNDDLTLHSAKRRRTNFVSSINLKAK